MRERERILDLVKKGVITTEEALILLEGIATAKDERVIEKEAIQVKNNPVTFTETEETVAKSPADSEVAEEETVVTADESPEDSQEKADFEEFLDAEEKDRQHFEKILENLASEMNQVSADLDQINADLSGAEQTRSELEEKIMVLNTMEELEALAEEKVVERQALEEELTNLNLHIEELRSEKAVLEIQLRDLRKEHRSEKAESWSSKFEIPEDWKESADETMRKVGANVSDVGNQIGRILKKTFTSVSDAVNENVDWKDINIKVPGVASTKFNHTFFYPSIAATLLDVKVANGEVTFKAWNEEDVKVDAEIKLYGKMVADSPFEAFLERSQIDVDDERISFQIPNKRIRVDLVFYLPRRVYDHVSVKMLNGKITVDALDAKDVYVKTTNGDMTFKELNATMLEIEGVNGNIRHDAGQILDLLTETVNGTITIRGMIDNMNVNSMNGDIKITSYNENLNKIEASVVNGAVKVAVPETIGLEINAKTSLGSIQHKLADADIIREKKDKTNQLLEMRRVPVGVEKLANLRLKTTTGNIFIKNNQD